MSNYTHQTTHVVKVPEYKPTEPAMTALFDALRIRGEREGSFDPNLLHGENRQEYLTSILEEIEARCRAWKHQVYELGGLLCAAKRILPHGDFKPWVRDHFPLGYRTGINCMRVFAACMNCPEMVDYIPRSCLYVVTEPQFPVDLRTVLFDNITGPVAMDRVALVLVDCTIDFGSGM